MLHREFNPGKNGVSGISSVLWGFVGGLTGISDRPLHGTTTPGLSEDRASPGVRDLLLVRHLSGSGVGGALDHFGQRLVVVVFVVVVVDGGGRHGSRLSMETLLIRRSLCLLIASRLS